MPKSQRGNLVAVAIPMYQNALNNEELTSLRHLTHFLGQYDLFLIAPQELQISMDGFQVKRFPDRYFESTTSYSKLLLSRSFYERLVDYKYILVYQLDALVFSSNLERWCNTGYDYIGAPWFRDPDHPERGLSRCGNGGFSLRRVEAFLSVLNSRHTLKNSPQTWRELLFRPMPDVDLKFNGVGRLAKRMKVLRDVIKGIDWYIQNYSLNEDHFWADRARYFDPSFKVAPLEVSLPFAFERAPKKCYEANDYKPPFGCHAWFKWDRDFWEPFLLEAR